ncbi:MAG: LacI family DNA-binding transcriptional regulator [Actinomycetales bacterium]
MTRSRAIRLLDVAHHAGVSLSTASRALSGSDGVRPSLAELVHESARELGYVANVHARSLAGGASASVGLVVHEIGDPYFTEIASGVLGVATGEGLTVQICHAGRDPENELLQIRTLVVSRVRAVVVAGSGYTDPRAESATRRELAAFQAQGGRVAVIGRHGFQADAVLPDNVGGGRSVAEHVLSLGHRRLAVVAGARSLTTVADRLRGVESVLTQAGLDLADVPVLEVPFTREGGQAAARRILAEHPATTAILALNDVMAMGVLSVLRQLGVTVPGRVSVTGFDDVAVAQDLSPSLTTVSLPMRDMGRTAVELTLRPAAARPRRKAVEHTLVVRGSTGPVPG